MMIECGCSISEAAYYETAMAPLAQRERGRHALGSTRVPMSTASMSQLQQKCLAIHPLEVDIMHLGGSPRTGLLMI